MDEANIKAQDVRELHEGQRDIADAKCSYAPFEAIRPPSRLSWNFFSSDSTAISLFRFASPPISRAKARKRTGRKIFADAALSRNEARTRVSLETPKPYGHKQ
eukprot:TRINITY_DN3065_c0_g3_i1.p1 TRINITY_DN3065_c0_g3~~TRINITY_DN3065_c0_g3_i1.p1  ORF type:complete len:103 (-),score=0.83 TRINITY_DN3065_c0_g3_i1:55-363(-)